MRVTYLEGSENFKQSVDFACQEARKILGINQTPVCFEGSFADSFIQAEHLTNAFSSFAMSGLFAAPIRKGDKACSARFEGYTFVKTEPSERWVKSDTTAQRTYSSGAKVEDSTLRKEQVLTLTFEPGFSFSVFYGTAVNEAKTMEG